MRDLLDRAVDAVFAVVGFPFAMVQLWLDSKEEDG